MSFHRSWAPDDRPPPHDQAHAHAPFLVHLMSAISDLSHSNGRIEATLDHMGSRLEDGDRKFGEIKDDLADVKGELSALKTSSQPPRPSRVLALKSLLETLAPMVKEAWPFLAVAGAAIVRWLGYDPGAIFGHP